MYSIEKVPTKMFKILLKYLEGLFMNDFRKLIIARAKNKVESDEFIKLDPIHEKLSDEDKEQMMKIKRKRALKLLEKLDK